MPIGDVARLVELIVCPCCHVVTEPGGAGILDIMLHRDGCRFVAWLLILSAVFWMPIILRSCSDGPLRPTDLETRP